MPGMYTVPQPNIGYVIEREDGEYYTGSPYKKTDTSSILNPLFVKDIDAALIIINKDYGKGIIEALKVIEYIEKVRTSIDEIKLIEVDINVKL